jgi:hypothetical protein
MEKCLEKNILYTPCCLREQLVGGEEAHDDEGQVSHDVALHVAIERHIFKPAFHLIGARFETRHLSAMGQGESTCTRPTMWEMAPPSMRLSGLPPL